MNTRTSLLLASTCLVSIVSTPAWAQDTSAPAASTPPAASEEVVITGYSQSLRDSAATKRRANSIVDVISAEDVGKFPDKNVAESLSHLPGVTVDHQFGEGEQVSIAGVEPALNRILIDGHSVASADWAAIRPIVRAAASTIRCSPPRSSRRPSSTRRRKRACRKVRSAARS